MARRIVQSNENGIVVVRCISNPYEKMFIQLYEYGLRDPYEIARVLNYNVNFVKRYINGLRKKGWIIEEGKKMEVKIKE